MGFFSDLFGTGVTNLTPEELRRISDVEREKRIIRNKIQDEKQRQIKEQERSARLRREMPGILRGLKGKLKAVAKAGNAEIMVLSDPKDRYYLSVVEGILRDESGYREFKFRIKELTKTVGNGACSEATIGYELYISW